MRLLSDTGEAGYYVGCLLVLDEIEVVNVSVGFDWVRVRGYWFVNNEASYFLDGIL